MVMTALKGGEFNTRPMAADDLVTDDVVNLKGGPAKIIGTGYLPLSDRVVLLVKDVNTWADMYSWSGWTSAACPRPPVTREIIVPSGAIFPTFRDRAVDR